MVKVRTCYVGIRPSDLTGYGFTKDRLALERAVIMAPVTFSDAKTCELHRNLRAIDHNMLLTRLEPHQLCRPDERFIPEDELRRLYADFPQIIRNTEKIMEECTIGFDFKVCKNKKTFTGDPLR